MDEDDAASVVETVIKVYRQGDTELVDQLLKRAVHNDITPTQLFEEIVMQTGGDV